ncbi:peptidoglycan DD-metalloendopeptidase family protein [Anaerobacillus sp. MEB173]|uniref:peptidoglycan DD-metalloendopeptidase family protein n=1 Tax=Anaerobacillus sp. MEB173 TaxID=3383345 RepID=UPI003F8FF542
MREEEKNSQENEKSFNVKRFMRKRWVLPAVYLGSAALILSAFIWMQGGSDDATPGDEFDMNELAGEYSDAYPNEDAVPVTTTNENIQMPVVDENEVTIVGYFYDYEASADEQQAALVFYNNTYYQNKGIDLASENGESFDVTASLSGTVVKAEKDALLGHVVQIEHENGVVTHYQSLEDVQVEEGQEVKQGDILGRAGRNEYNRDAGVHVHFEIRQDGIPVNPIDYFNQPITALPQNEQADEAEKDEPKEVEEEADVTDENNEDHATDDKEKEEEKDKEQEEDKEE